MSWLANLDGGVLASGSANWRYHPQNRQQVGSLGRTPVPVSGGRGPDLWITEAIVRAARQERPVALSA